MDLQTRKKTFVKEFLAINNEDVILRLEKKMKKERDLLSENKHFITINQEIDIAVDDAKKGRLIDVFDLKEKVKQWN